MLGAAGRRVELLARDNGELHLAALRCPERDGECLLDARFCHDNCAVDVYARRGAPLGVDVLCAAATCTQLTLHCLSLIHI